MTRRPAHPDTDWHGWNYEAGEWWHYSAPPHSRALEPCRCEADPPYDQIIEDEPQAKETP